MPLLPHRRVAQGALGAALLGQQEDVLRRVGPPALRPLPGAEGDQQHVADPPVHAGTQRKRPRGRQEPAARRARRGPQPAGQHVAQDSAGIGDLRLVPGAGLGELLAGGRGWRGLPGWARPQGELPASHVSR